MFWNFFISTVSQNVKSSLVTDFYESKIIPVTYCQNQNQEYETWVAVSEMFRDKDKQFEHEK